MFIKQRFSFFSLSSWLLLNVILLFSYGNHYNVLGMENQNDNNNYIPATTTTNYLVLEERHLQQQENEPSSNSTNTTNTNTTKVTSPASAPQMVPTSTTTGSSDTTTFAPSTSMSPSYEEKCYVCGNSDDDDDDDTDDTAAVQVLSFDKNVTVLGSIVTCGALFTAGTNGLIPPGACDIAIEIATLQCDCSNIVGSILNDTVPSPSTIGSSTVVPTNIPGPCYLCGSMDLYVRNSTNMVSILDQEIDCGTLDSSARNGNLPTGLCQIASDVASIGCGGCVTTMSPSSLQTFPPTTSVAPSITPFPSTSTPCYICGSSDYTLFVAPTNTTEEEDDEKNMNMNEMISIGTELYSCQYLQEEGLNRFIDTNTCSMIQERIRTMAGTTNETTTNSSSSSSSSNTGCTCVPSGSDTPSDIGSNVPTSVPQQPTETQPNGTPPSSNTVVAGKDNTDTTVPPTLPPDSGVTALSGIRTSTTIVFVLAILFVMD